MDVRQGSALNCDVRKIGLNLASLKKEMRTIEKKTKHISCRIMNISMDRRIHNSFSDLSLLIFFAFFPGFYLLTSNNTDYSLGT